MASQEDVNRQHMASMGLDPDSLGKAAPKPLEDHRCPSRMPGYLEKQCVLDDGHNGTHVRGKDRWSDPEGRVRPLIEFSTDPLEPENPIKGYLESLTQPIKQREGDQPLPVVNDHPDIQAAVIADIEKRREIGIQRYGTALQPNNGRDALQDLYEELIDACMYIKQLMVERGLNRDLRGGS